MKKSVSFVLAMVMLVSTFSCLNLSAFAVDDVVTESSVLEGSEDLAFSQYYSEDLCESAHPYSNNMDDTWVITRPGASDVLIEFSEETSVESKYDKIIIYNGSDEVVGEYTGTELAGVEIGISGDTVKIRLVTDVSQTYYGFSLTRVRGIYQSAHPYSPNTDYTWVINKPGAKNITIDFSEDTIVETNYDKIKIYDFNDNLVGEYTGTQLAGQSVCVEGDVVKVQLTTDGSVQDYGLFFYDSAATYGCTDHDWSGWITETEATCLTDGSQYRYCYICNETEYETIYASGHNFVGLSCGGCGITETYESEHPYADNTDETWVVCRRGASRIWVTFSDDTLLESGYDKIIIYDCNDNIVGEYTYTDLAGATVYVTGDTAKIRLITDTSVQRYGFLVTDVGYSYDSCSVHDWSSWTTDTEATCGENGSLFRYCYTCGTTETEEIPATGQHSFSDGWCMVCGAQELYESEHPYANSADQVWNIYRPGATGIWVTFSENTEFESGCDFLTIYDGYGSLIGEYSGTELAGATVYADGESMQLRLTTDGSVQYYGFTITDIGEFYGCVSHSWSEWSTDVEATCVTDGLQSRYCYSCGETETQTIYCSGHSYSDWQIDCAATCVTDGLQSRYCYSCGETETQPIYAVGYHDFCDWIIDSAATCTRDGQEHRYCYVCDYTEQVTRAATGHDYEDDICVNCGECSVYESAHPYANNTDRTWTIYREGATRVEVTFSTQTYVENSYDKIRIYDGSDNLIGQYTNSQLAGQTVVVPGDTVKIRLTSDGSVQEYGFLVTDIAPYYTVAHSWSEWVVDYDATCTSDGLKHRQCSICYEYEEETIYSTGHNYSDSWTIDVSANCSRQGSKSRHCLNCDSKTDVTVITATEHSYSDWVVYAESTCSSAGSRYKICSNCGDNVTETIPRRGHHHSVEWTIDVMPTCTTDGSKSRKCMNCDDRKNVTVIPATGHTPSEWIIDKEATLNSSGSKHNICTTCGKNLKTVKIKQLKCSAPKISKAENTTSGVKITWGKVSGADKYKVYRSKKKSGGYEYIGATSKTAYTDKKAKAGTTYYYKVKAVNEAGASSSSSAKSVKYLADPTLSTPKSTKSGITLKWSKVSGAQGYIVYRKTGSGSYSKLATVKGSTKVTYTDKSARKGKKYTYKVKAYYSKTYSAYSNTKTITDKY